MNSFIHEFLFQISLIFRLLFGYYSCPYLYHPYHHIILITISSLPSFIIIVITLIIIMIIILL